VIFSTFFHQKKVQVLWPYLDGCHQPALWALGFQGPVDSQSGMIINLKDVMQIQEGFLRSPPSVPPAEWLRQSCSFVQASNPSGASLPFVTALFFPELKFKLELHSEGLRWIFERHHVFEVGSQLVDVTLRRDLQSVDQFLPASQESWPRKFEAQDELERYLSGKGEYLLKPYLKSEGFTSLNF
jgi:hypothetical protein